MVETLPSTYTVVALLLLLLLLLLLSLLMCNHCLVVCFDCEPIAAVAMKNIIPVLQSKRVVALL